ncbi:MAG: Rieske (2Fe-2S) protein [Zoogloeaceae bacterium]|nr:Rieske (2Fe-2S) protein [Rhodocyclaceae bacterium]MCP5235402.1 Rieske (2Fe-2S) protein [Zoogloeaceae bacterium]
MKNKSNEQAPAGAITRAPDDCPSPQRRKTFKLMACAALAATAGIRPSFADGDGPQVGDLLVRDGDESKTPLTSADVKLEKKQLIVYPLDPKSMTVRDGSRLNRIIVIKLDPTQMDDKTAPLAADGIIAFSAVCVHQNCDVNGWLPKEKEFLCVCHFSKYSPLRHGEVTGGPAPRPLPMIPVKLDGDKLVIAGEFNAAPGGAPQA